MIDRYTKIILTVIACALVTLAFQGSTHLAVAEQGTEPAFLKYLSWEQRAQLRQEAEAQSRWNTLIKSKSTWTRGSPAEPCYVAVSLGNKINVDVKSLPVR